MRFTILLKSSKVVGLVEVDHISERETIVKREKKSNGGKTERKRERKI